MGELIRNEADLRVQRAIEGRYLADARADRRAIQKEHRAQLEAPRSSVSWDSRATLADVRKEKAAAAARAAAPLTPEDVRLRKASAARDQRWDHKRHGTPATLDHAEAHKTGALARLCQAGAITADQLAAALDIDQEYERLARDVTPRTASFETRVDLGGRGGNPAVDERLGRVQREVAFRTWSRAVGAPIGAVLEMIVGDPPGYSIVARRWRMSARRAKTLLIEALDLWWAQLAAARRDIGADDLARLQAAI